MKTTVRSIQSFRASFEALQRRAKRLGIEPPTFSILANRREPTEVHTYDQKGILLGSRVVDFEVHDIEVAGFQRTIMLGGWEFMAKLTPHGDANIVSGFGGDQIPELYRTCAIGCDHCSSNRKRNDSFVLRKDEEFKQIGRNCLSNFTQAASAERLVALFEFWGSVSEFVGGYNEGERGVFEGFGIQAYSLNVCVALALEAHKGAYISAAMSDEKGVMSTADEVKAAITHKRNPSPESEDQARLWLEEAVLLKDDGSSYMANLKTIIRSGYVTWKTMGVGVSLIAAVNRSKRVKAEVEEKAKSEYVGVVGGRITVEGEVVNRFGYATAFGWVEKVVLRTVDGNLLVGKNLPGTVGDTIRLKATIKEHSEYRGAKQTILARPHKPEIISKAA
jgi:hypothetical protein